MFIIVAPQNAVGNCIIDVRNLRANLLLKHFGHCIYQMCFSSTILYLVVLRLNMQDLKAMTDAAGNRPVILVNPKLKVQYLL
jgi:hypothetical protein